MGEHGKAISGYVFVEQDTSLRIAQQASQRSLALQEREFAQIPEVPTINPGRRRSGTAPVVFAGTVGPRRPNPTPTRRRPAQLVDLAA
jgi:hypothetical protein